MMLPMLLVLLLVTTIGSVILYLRTAHDIFGVLAVATAIVCLIWGLVIAHWSVHLIALISLLFIRKPSARASLVSPNK